MGYQRLLEETGLAESEFSAHDFERAVELAFIKSKGNEELAEILLPYIIREKVFRNYINNRGKRNE